MTLAAGLKLVADRERSAALSPSSPRITIWKSQASDKTRRRGQLGSDGSSGSIWMLYVVEIRRERPLAKVLSDLREWLDAKRFEPVAFRCLTEKDCIICRLEFQFESEAVACAAVFDGTVAHRSGRDRLGVL